MGEPRSSCWEALVAQELGYPTVPFLRMGKEPVATLAHADGQCCTIRG